MTKTTPTKKRKHWICRTCGGKKLVGRAVGPHVARKHDIAEETAPRQSCLKCGKPGHNARSCSVKPKMISDERKNKIIAAARRERTSR